MSVGHTQCYCGSILQGVSEDVQEHIMKTAIQNFHMLTTSAFEIKKVETSMKKAKQRSTVSWPSQRRCISVRKKGYNTFPARYEDDTHDEEASIDRVRTNRNNHRSSNHRNSSTRTHDRGNGGIRKVGTTSHEVMINGSHRQTLIGESTYSNE